MKSANIRDFFSTGIKDQALTIFVDILLKSHTNFF